MLGNIRKNTVGVFLMLAAAFFFAVLDGLIKLLGPPFRVWDIAFYRFSFGFAFLVTIFGWKRNPFKGYRPKLLIARGITGSFAFVALVAAIRLIPISTAMVLAYNMVGDSLRDMFDPREIMGHKGRGKS